MQRARLDTPLKQLLEAQGRRYGWIAEQLGVSRQSVSFWVHGVSIPTDANKQRIADLLGVTVAELWPESEEAVA